MKKCLTLLNLINTKSVHILLHILYILTFLFFLRMKKLFFVAVAAIAMLATSCSKDDASTVVGGETSTVTFAVEAPVMATRADLGDGTTATDLSWAVYAEDGTYLEALSGSKAGAFSSLKANVEIELVNGKKYAVIFWAQAPGAPYTFDKAAKKVTVADALTANAEAYDAFYKYETIAEVAGPRTQTIVLTRPFAQLNIATADTAKAADGGLVVAKTKVVVPAYNTLNLVDGSVSGEAERTYAMADILTGETIEVGGKTYDLLSMNYILVNTKELEIVKFTVKNGTFEEEFTYNNVPLQRNYKTNIIGNLLTSTYDFTIEINPIFADEYDYAGAMVNNTTYKTVQEAVNAATDGAVIEIAAGTYNEVVKVTGGKNITLKANGEVILAGLDHQSNGTPSTVKVKGITFDNSIVTTRAEGGWFTGTAKEIAPCVGAWGGHFTFDDCKFIVAGTSDRETGVMTWWTTDLVTFKFNNCVFEGKDNHASARAMQIYGTVDMEVNNCTFTTAKDYSLKYVGEEGNVAVFNGNEVENSKYFVQLGSSTYPGKNYTVEINDTTLVGETVNCFIDNKEGQTVIVDGVTEIIGGEVAVAELNGKWYSSLNAAIAAIEGNEAEISVKAGTYNLPVVQNKSLTLTGIGNREEIIVNHTSSQNLSGSTLICNNVTIQGATSNYKGFHHTAACEFNNCIVKDLLFLYSPTKFTGCKFVATQTEHNVWTYGANKVEFVDCEFNYSDRCVNVYVDNGTGSAAVAFDGCTFVTENTASEGAVEVNSSAFPQGVTVDFNGCTAPAHGKMVYISKWDGTKGKNATITIDGSYFFVKGNEVETVNVTSVAELKEELTKAGAEGAGYTVIELAAGTYTAPADWTPIDVDGYNGADIVTLNGNGATIKGLDAALFAGGFAGGSGIVIKDLTIEDATIVADNDQGYGAFVNCADSMDEITLINCHLKNSTIITPNDGAAESRIGGLVGWTAGYNVQNDGPVDSYITIKDCSVVGCTIKGFGSIGGICGHAGANAATFTTIENCTVTNNKFISTDDGGWRVGVVVGTANNGQCVIKNITESGNTLEQVGKTAPTGEKRNYYGRFVPSGTGTLTIDGVAIQ